MRTPSSIPTWNPSHFSGYHRVLRVARTLADLDDKVGRVHLAEALS